MLLVVLLGGPGVDTVGLATRLANATGLIPASIGNAFRSTVRTGTALGLRLRDVVAAGKQAPQEVMVEVFADAVAATNGRWVVSNFPSTVTAARLLGQRGLGPDAVVDLAIDDDEMAVRLQRTCGDCSSALHVAYRLPRRAGVCDLCGGVLGLPDEVVAGRIERYRRQFEPVVAYFHNAGVVQVVDGSIGHDEITTHLTEILRTGAPATGPGG
jgi:adenylate kinase